MDAVPRPRRHGRARRGLAGRAGARRPSSGDGARRDQITEQGEIVSQNFGLMSVAERSLELMLSGVLLHRFEDWRNGLGPGEEARFREVMDRLAAEALPRYRALVYGSADLFKLFLETTPVRELADVRFGSRPAYRGPGQETMEGIRAIPGCSGGRRRASCYRDGWALAPRSKPSAASRAGSRYCAAWLTPGRSSTTCSPRSRWSVPRPTSPSRGCTCGSWGRQRPRAVRPPGRRVPAHHRRPAAHPGKRLSHA